MNDKVSIRHRTFAETVTHYRQLRHATHAFTENRFKAFAISMREISHADAVAADQWGAGWAEQKKKPTWEWVRQYHLHQENTCIKRFDAAVSVGGVLCALCYGIPTRAKLTLKIHTLARKPENNPLAGNVRRVMLFAALTYARLLGCKEIWLCNPLNEELVPVYTRSGYVAHKNRFGKTTHLVMRLDYDQ